MRGGNADKGNDGHIGSSTTTIDDEIGETTIIENDNIETTDDARILDTYDDYENRINGLPSRIRRNIEGGIDDIFHDRKDDSARNDIK